MSLRRDSLTGRWRVGGRGDGGEVFVLEEEVCVSELDGGEAGVEGAIVVTAGVSGS